MSDIVSSIDYVLRQEDATMSGVITDDTWDTGGKTRFGVAQHFHPELTPSGFYDSMSTADALVVAHRVYTFSYAGPLLLVQMRSQKVANALLSFAINEGVEPCVKILQNTLASMKLSVTTDGVMGSQTINALNSVDETLLLKMLAINQRGHYDAICAANPNDRKFYNGWMNRITANCGVA